MDQTNYRKHILNQIFSELQSQSLVKNKKDFAVKVHYDYCCMSSALNGNPKYLTDKLFSKVFSAFPGLNKANYPLNSANSPTQVSSVLPHTEKTINEQASSTGQINKILMLLEQQQQLTANSQVQIDKMIKSIDRLVEQVCKLSSEASQNIPDDSFSTFITK